MDMHSLALQRQQFLKNRSTPLTVGFVALVTGNSPAEEAAIAGIQQAAKEYGITNLILIDTLPALGISASPLLPQLATKLHCLRAPLVDGCILWVSSFSKALPLKHIQKLFLSLAPLPLVTIGSCTLPQVPCVRTDSDAAVQQVVDHLTQVHGFSRIAFVGSKTKKVFRTGIFCPASALFLLDSFDAATIVATTQKLLAQRPLYEAIVTANDTIAATVIETIETAGLSVPDDIAVVSCAREHAGIAAISPVTTVSGSHFAQGYQAVSVLIDRIMQPQQQVPHHWVKPTLIIRQSCGCFEPDVSEAAQLAQNFSALPSAQIDTRAYVQQRVKQLFMQESPALQAALTQAILTDMHAEQPIEQGSALVRWFRNALKRRHRAPRNWQADISALRALIVPLVRTNPVLLQQCENTFHALRTLHAVTQHYDLQHAYRAVPYTTHTLALRLATVENRAQLKNTLRATMGDLGVSGLILALSPYLSERLGITQVTLVLPDTTGELQKLLPYQLREPQLMPRAFLSQANGACITLFVLEQQNLFMGYLYLFTAEKELARYDEVKLLLSKTLYRLYLHEGNIKPHALAVTNRTALLQQLSLPAPPTQQARVTRQALLEYLTDHLDELCDLDKMAAHFHLSKSHLLRLAKAQTGYTIQHLHELLKIAQAKEFLKNDSLKIHDIAARLGYTTPSYFSTVFKKVTGFAPLVWAEQHCQR